VLVMQVVFLTHRNAFCWMDEWFDLTFDEVCNSPKLLDKSIFEHHLFVP
jgi:hypothetical protein